MSDVQVYKPTHHIRIVTAASLFDGHDAAINIMRRILQASGAEVIHLGHNRSVGEIVDCAIQEDAQGIAITSYQGGHVEYLKYMYDLLKERKANIKIFAGGGGTILPSEINDLHAYGVDRIYSPDDGRELGLQGMINDLLEKCDFSTRKPPGDDLVESMRAKTAKDMGHLISLAENYPEENSKNQEAIRKLAETKTIPVLGITGTGGAGKSSLVDELVRRYLLDFPDKTIAIVSVDPSKRKSGGALLGDRIRMNAINNPRVYMRSLATRQSNLALSRYVQDSIEVCKAAGYDLVIVETSGIGQSDTEITEHSDLSLYVMTSEYGAATQLEKIDMLDFADMIAINKFDKRGSLDALRDVRKQYKRNHQLFSTDDDELPIYGTIASLFNDTGTNLLYKKLMAKISEKFSGQFPSSLELETRSSERKFIIPPDRVRYLAEIVEDSRRYDQSVQEQQVLGNQAYGLFQSICLLRGIESNDFLPELAAETNDSEATRSLVEQYTLVLDKMNADSKQAIRAWPETVKTYSGSTYSYQVRDKTFELPLTTKSLSGKDIPKICLPTWSAWGDILNWLSHENVPGSFPYAAGVFPLKRQGEDPARMFAGEGGPERTNKRFHYVSSGLPAKRLSTAFDSVTLYGENPDKRPDIYGKIGNSGVSIATLDDAKKLYSGFDLCAPSTSVSMTINGPAPMLLGFFMNAAIDQRCEQYIHAENLWDSVNKKIAELYKGKTRPAYQGDLPEGNDGLGLGLLGVTGDLVLPPDVYEKIKAEAMSAVRGTVQADILKEDQAQNTCIFSTEFALRMMGDIQEYFVQNKIRNFYSVSISGYHIAEAGANPITQLALTLANGFTFIEYYKARGMHVDDFAPNFSFFFSNGLDPEYSVIGRVARRIWAKAIKHKYGGNERSQKLKYHIQTSGRSLHAQEIAFNDIRTTLQALYALYDNCNSLHTNAYDEAITTPTEESVRRAMAIQLIINKELGLNTNENPLQGSFAIEKLTQIVEDAVLKEFEAISERGGVLGAMERMYQRTKIQEESLYYEHRKHTGDLPIIGVNTFLDSKGSPTIVPEEVIRSTEEERNYAIDSLKTYEATHHDRSVKALEQLKQAALNHDNIFNAIIDAAKSCSLGQMSGALYEVGGQYRRNM